MHGNIIPRNCRKLRVTFLADIGGLRAGDVRILEKTEYDGWTDGEYSYFASMLRIAEVCSLEPLYD